MPSDQPYDLERPAFDNSSYDQENLRKPTGHKSSGKPRRKYESVGGNVDRERASRIKER